jgi:hypothetical protein
MAVTDRVSFGAAALRIGAGVIIWAVHFAVIYGYTGLACARRFTESGETWLALVPWVLAFATVLGVAVAAAFVPAAVRATRTQFVEWVSGWVAAFAVLAMVLEGITILWVPVCD